ncbi:cupin [Rhodovibrionaceae bacterium A322]
MTDEKSAGTAKGLTYIKNDVTVVTEWSFPKKGDNTGWHTHELDYVVVPLTDGFLEIKTPDGKTTRAELKTGVPYYRDKGVKHDVINGSDHPMAFIEVEILP